jgi:hypothetical protein
MTRLEYMIAYRSKLFTDLSARIDAHIALGDPYLVPVEKHRELVDFQMKVMKRIRLMEPEIDKERQKLAERGGPAPRKFVFIPAPVAGAAHAHA